MVQSTKEEISQESRSIYVQSRSGIRSRGLRSVEVPLEKVDADKLLQKQHVTESFDWIMKERARWIVRQQIVACIAPVCGKDKIEKASCRQNRDKLNANRARIINFRSGKKLQAIKIEECVRPGEVEQDSKFNSSVNWHRQITPKSTPAMNKFVGVLPETNKADLKSDCIWFLFLSSPY